MEDIGHIAFGVIKSSVPKARMIGIAIRVNRYRTFMHFDSFIAK